MVVVMTLADAIARTCDGMLFSGPLVPLVLNGSKTVTRRMSKRLLKREAGDLLFVRETWAAIDATCDEWVAPEDAEDHRCGPDCKQRYIYYQSTPRVGQRVLPKYERITYLGEETPLDYLSVKKWKPSIHMRRADSRCVIRLTEKPRLVRIQDIDDADAIREGVRRIDSGLLEGLWTFDLVASVNSRVSSSARYAFEDKWGQLHTKPGERWQDNPEVVRVAFERVA